ncbi:MAG: hypothetical protein ACPHK2_03905, partial [Candidatus Poseidoniaceae archaeon]
IYHSHQAPYGLYVLSRRFYPIYEHWGANSFIRLRRTCFLKENIEMKSVENVLKLQEIYKKK